MLEKYYSVLGLQTSSSSEEIKERYKSLYEVAVEKGDEHAQSTLSEAYFMIMSSKQTSNAPQFALQRVPIKAKLDKPLSLGGVKKIIIGAMATLMLLSTAACSKAQGEQGEIGNSKEGYYYYDPANNLAKIKNTDDYYLIRIDNHIFLARSYEKIYRNSESSIKINRKNYYTIKNSDQKIPCIGTTLEISDFTSLKDDVPISTTTYDYYFFEGQYGINKLLPAGSVVSLSEFITSQKPSVSDIEFWSSDSEEVHKAFDNIVLSDLIYSLEKDIEGEKTTYTFENQLSSFKCTSTNEEIITLLGYRASTNQEDIGYNYVYNVFDSKIYYIGLYKEDAFVTVEESRVEGGKTLSEYRKMFGGDFQYHDDSNKKIPTEQENETSFDDNTPHKDITNEEPSSSEDLLTVKDLEGNLDKIKKYQNVKVVDLSAIPDKDSVSPFLEKGIKYLFIDEKKDLIISMTDDKIKEYLLIHERIDGTTYFSFTDGENGITCTLNYADFICTLDEFLNKNGLENHVKDSYTYGDLAQIEQGFNSRTTQKYSADEIVIVDLGENLEYPRYSIFRRKKDAYSNPQETAYITEPQSENPVYYFNLSKTDSIAASSLSLSEFIQSCLDHNIEWATKITWQEEYSDMDLTLIEDMINGYENFGLTADIKNSIDGKAFTLKEQE